jgi:SAM-dependent methyltransferase
MLLPKNARNLLSYLGPKRWRSRKVLREFDRRFGVDTAPVTEVSDLGLPPEIAAEAVRYQPIVAIDPYLRRLPISFEAYAFVDYGCGKGRALLMASEYPFAEIIGIEYAASLVAIARANIQRFRSKTQKCRKLSVVEINASDFQPPSKPTVYFFYNPFGRPVLERVLDRIRQARSTNKPMSYLIYVDPQHRSCLSAASEWDVLADYGSWVIYESSPSAPEVDAVTAGAASV